MGPNISPPPPSGSRGPKVRALTGLGCILLTTSRRSFAGVVFSDLFLHAVLIFFVADSTTLLLAQAPSLQALLQLRDDLGLLAEMAANAAHAVRVVGEDLLVGDVHRRGADAAAAAELLCKWTQIGFKMGAFEGQTLPMKGMQSTQW